MSPLRSRSIDSINALGGRRYCTIRRAHVLGLGLALVIGEGEGRNGRPFSPTFAIELISCERRAEVQLVSVCWSDSEGRNASYWALWRAADPRGLPIEERVRAVKETLRKQTRSPPALFLEQALCNRACCRGV
jgi:hypothetical protein